MKLNRIFITLAAVLSLSAVSCVKERAEIETYPRNEGEEYLTVSVDALEFLGRGATMSFSVEASYDGKIEAEDWISLTAKAFPGDKRSYIFQAVVDANKTGAVREGKIVISTSSVVKEISVTQPAYNRPEIPSVIKTADEFATFLKDQAPYVEENEVIKLGATIDMKGVALVPAEYFKGILDGEGNSIINLKATTPLISANYGVLRNITIGEGSAFSVTPSITRFGSFVGENNGLIDNCENRAPLTLSEANPERIYIGGIAGYNIEGANINACRNYGAIKVDGITTTINFYLGGMSGYSFGNFTACDNYGPINVSVVNIATAQIFFGGITPRLETGVIKGCVNHKEAKVTVKGSGKSGNIYGGGLVGYHEGVSDMRESANYADIEVTLNNGNNYIGGLLGWQAKVTSAPFAILEDCIVNCNMTGVKQAAGQYGVNPTQSAGLVLGRFSGQANNQVCNVGGTGDKPIKVSGSVYCTATKTKVVATAKTFGDLVDGDGSATNLNSAASTWQVFNCVYEVMGDGQTGPAEDLQVKTDPLTLYVPCDGGDASFMVNANYDATLSTDCEWITIPEDAVTVKGDGEDHIVTVKVAANETTKAREGSVLVSLPLGTNRTVVISQAATVNVPESVELSVANITADPAGKESASFTVTANYDAVVATDAAWIKLSTAAVAGDQDPHEITLTFAENLGDARSADVTVTLPKGLSKKVTVSQAHYDKPSYLTEIATKADFLDFISKAGDASIYTAEIATKLTADIDLAGETLSPAGCYLGTFDGQGHKLKNWTAEGPLFAQIKGCVKNLVIDASCKANFKYENTTLNGSNHCIGVICGDLLAGSIEGCTNSAPVTMVTYGDAATFVGGISGRSQASALVKGCVNNGAISIRPDAAVSVSYRIAGIVGGSNGNIEGCTNNAPVEFAPVEITGGNQFLGGIAAYLAKNADQTLAGCTNTKNAKISFVPVAVSNIAQSYVGGVLGYLDGQLTELTNFSGDKNFGDVYCSANNELVAVGGLLGWSKAGGNPNTWLWNSAVNCNVSAAFKSSDASAVNPCQSAGLIIGRVALKSGAANVTAVIGTPEAPVKVAGTVTCIGGATVTASAANLNDVIKGSGFADTNNKATFNAVYEAVTKE